MTAAHLSGREA